MLYFLFLNQTSVTTKITHRTKLNIEKFKSYKTKICNNFFNKKGFQIKHYSIKFTFKICFLTQN